VTVLKNSIERYILWLAPALAISFLARYFGHGPGLEHLSGPAIQMLLGPADVISIAAFVALLPLFVTAIWMFLDSNSSPVVRVAWFVSGLLMSYLVLIPYIGSKLLLEKDARSDSTAI
jgi:hypothetical protein